MSDAQIVKVGIGVMILKDGKVLMARRKNAHGAGEYAFPGGHLEFGESFEDCAIRETAEETGIKIKDIRFEFIGNFVKYDKHYVHIGLLAEWASGEPTVLEPEKSEEWSWHDLDDLPSPLFAMCIKAIESYRTKQTYFGTIS